MTFWQKLKKAILQPKIWLIFVVYITFAGVMAALICSFVLNFAPWLNYLLYALSAIFLTYVVYTVVYLAPRIKGALMRWADSKHLTSSFVHDYGFRTIVFSIGSFCFNLAYAVFEFVLALFWRSFWLAVLAGYYAFLTFLRGGILLQHKKNSSLQTTGVDTDREETKLFRNCGITLMVLSLTMWGAVFQMNPLSSPFINAEIYIIVLAAYTFTKIIFAIYNIIKARKQSGLIVRALRNINLITATVAMYVLMIAMLNVYSTDSTLLTYLKPIGAIALWVVTFVSGLLMTVYACRRLKVIEKKEE